MTGRDDGGSRSDSNGGWRRRQWRGFRIALLAALVAAWAAACGDGGTVTEPPPAPNRAPVAAGAIPPQTMTVGQTAPVNLASFFTDPDGDALTYAATTSNATVATVSVAGSLMTVTAVAAGTVTVTVTATDPGGLSASQSFTVTVEAGGGTRTYQTGETISTLPTGFWTPDVTSGASFQFSSGQVTISFNNGGYIEEAGIRYTCRASGGCRVVNRVVSQGTIEASGGGGRGGRGRRGPRGAGDALQRDGRAELGEQRQLADRRAAWRLVRRRYGC